VRHRRPIDEAPGRRVFVAVPIPPETVDTIAVLVESVRADADPAIRDVRWVRLNGLHLTLRFLGPATDDRLAGIVSAVDRVAAATSPFRVEIGGGGAFPAIARPRTLWLGVRDGAADLASAAARLDDGLAEAGWPRPDRPYRPHLTLARSDGVRAGPRVAGRLIAAAESLRAPFEAASVALFETVSGDGRAHYVALHEAPFASRASREGGAPEDGSGPSGVLPSRLSAGARARNEPAEGDE
jgi:2'-5' RNA ligase